MFKNVLYIVGHKRLSGDDLFLLLENIILHGSISRAASEAGVSYRYAWGLIQEAEKALKITLLEKHVGGYAGGGALLTAEGKMMLQEYRAYKESVAHRLDRFMGKALQLEEIPRTEEIARKPDSYLLLASTLEPVEAGLMDELEGAYYRERGILVRHLAAGSGKALEIARGGRVDMVLTHAPELEEQFMNEGWGAFQAPVMSSNFILVGPGADPAGLKKTRKVTEAFRQIALSGSPFVTRGDHSGTHLRESELWEKAGFTPGGDWYLFYPGVAGNLGALRFALEKKAYMLTDTASFYLSGGEQEMEIFINGNKESAKELANIFVLTLVNPEKAPSSGLEQAAQFARWLQKEGGRKIIAHFGRELYGVPLFAHQST